MDTHADSHIRMTWRLALGMAVPIALFILAAFYYWFALADRYVIFLYGHVAQGIPKTEPFDEMTSTRYWMAGLVVTGAVLLLYTGFNGLLGWLGARRQRPYCAPPWWQVWLLCAVPLLIGIPAITMTTNNPTLPPALAAACTAATLLGLAFALWPGAWAAQRPRDLLWLIVDGAGLAPMLLLLHAVELPGRGLSVSMSVAIGAAIGSLATAIAWLGAMTGLRAWRHKTLPPAGALLATGLCLSYLLLPLAHYVLGRPDYRYITSSSNFFAFDAGLQVLVFAIGAAVAYGITQVRKRLPPWLRAEAYHLSSRTK